MTWYLTFEIKHLTSLDIWHFTYDISHMTWFDTIAETNIFIVKIGGRNIFIDALMKSKLFIDTFCFFRYLWLFCFLALLLNTLLEFQLKPNQFKSNCPFDLIWLELIWNFLNINYLCPVLVPFKSVMSYGTLSNKNLLGNENNYLPSFSSCVCLCFCLHTRKLINGKKL